jgi:hypothetical protein
MLRGGILPVLQITCERLYRRVRNEYGGSDRDWVITSKDYESLGKPEEQVDLYLDERIYEKIDQATPNIASDPEARKEEWARWKDFLFEFVVVEDDNRALTKIVSREKLKEIAVEHRCTVDFREMVSYLSRDEHRILREERSAAADVREEQRFYSLGHDAVAVTLSKWQETRSLIVGEKKKSDKRLLSSTIKTASTYFCAAVVVASYFGQPVEWERSWPLFILVVIVSLMLAASVILWLLASVIADYVVNSPTAAEWLDRRFWRWFRHVDRA